MKLAQVKCRNCRFVTDGEETVPLWGTKRQTKTGNKVRQKWCLGYRWETAAKVNNKVCSMNTKTKLLSYNMNTQHERTNNSELEKAKRNTWERWWGRVKGHLDVTALSSSTPDLAQTDNTHFLPSTRISTLNLKIQLSQDGESESRREWGIS